MDLLLAEDLMLLLLDDETGAVRQTHLRPLLGGAVLADLALTGAAEVEEKRGVWHTAKVHPVDGARPSDALLAAAYDEVAAKPRSAQDLVDLLVRGLTPDTRTMALVALLSAVDLAHKVVDREGLSGGEVRKRGKRLVEQMDDGDWAAKAVRDAVAAITAAAGAAAVAGGAAAASS